MKCQLSSCKSRAFFAKYGKKCATHCEAHKESNMIHLNTYYRVLNDKTYGYGYHLKRINNTEGLITTDNISKKMLLQNSKKRKVSHIYNELSSYKEDIEPMMDIYDEIKKFNKYSKFL